MACRVIVGRVIADHVARLVMAEGTGIRSALRKVSLKIIELLRRDPTNGSAL